MSLFVCLLFLSGICFAKNHVFTCQGRWVKGVCPREGHGVKVVFWQSMVDLVQYTLLPQHLSPHLCRHIGLSAADRPSWASRQFPSDPLSSLTLPVDMRDGIRRENPTDSTPPSSSTWSCLPFKPAWSGGSAHTTYVTSSGGVTLSFHTSHQAVWYVTSRFHASRWALRNGHAAHPRNASTNSWQQLFLRPLIFATNLLIGHSWQEFDLTPLVRRRSQRSQCSLTNVSQ